MFNEYSFKFFNAQKLSLRGGHSPLYDSQDDQGLNNQSKLRKITKQNKAKQNKTKQNRKKQNKTEQNRTT